MGLERICARGWRRPGRMLRTRKKAKRRHARIYSESSISKEEALSRTLRDGLRVQQRRRLKKSGNEQLRMQTARRGRRKPGPAGCSRLPEAALKGRSDNLRSLQLLVPQTSQKTAATESPPPQEENNSCSSRRQGFKNDWMQRNNGLNNQCPSFQNSPDLKFIPANHFSNL